MFEVLWLPEEKRPTLLDVPSSLWLRGGRSGKGGRDRRGVVKEGTVKGVGGGLSTLTTTAIYSVML